MGCFEDCMTDMLSPYGNTPLFSAGQTDATVTIVQESYDDGMKVTRIKTPPRTESSLLLEAIDSILGTMDMLGCLATEKNKPGKPDKKKEDGSDDDVQEEPESQNEQDGDSDSKLQKQPGSRPSLPSERVAQKD